MYNLIQEYWNYMQQHKFNVLVLHKDSLKTLFIFFTTLTLDNMAPRQIWQLHHLVKMYKDKEVKNVKNFFVNVWRKSIFDIYVTEYGTALTTILPILFLYLNTVTVTAGTFEP